MDANILSPALRSVCVAMCFTVLCLHGPNTYAWSYRGHALLTQQTYDNLLPQEKEYFLSAASVLDQKNKYKKTQKIGLLGAWADTQRGVKLKTLFKQFHQDVPKRLYPDADLTTDRWHYDNTFIRTPESGSSGLKCKVKNNGELLAKLELLNVVLFDKKSALTKQQEAIVLALQLHLLQDLHQPLHLLSSLDSKCKSDLGGNTKCLKKGGNRKCSLSLHQYWDGGLGEFAYSSLPLERSKINPNLAALQKPGNNSIQKTSTISVAEWAQESVHYWPVVYNTVDAPLSIRYEKQAKAVVKVQLDKCLQRSIAYLKTYYRFKASKNLISKIN